MIRDKLEYGKCTPRKMLRIERWISISIILALAPFMISGEDLLGAMRISLYVF